MFFALSKTIALLAMPSNFLMLCAVAGAVLLRTRFASFGRKLLTTAVVVLALAGFLPVGNLLLAALENRFPAWTSSGVPDGIIILGGAIDADLSAERGEVVIGSALTRLTVAPKLARDYPKARIVYSGGSGNLLGGASEADAAKPLFVALGIPAERIELERASRNTAENATMSKAQVNPKPGERWLLVTSAAHMPRAIGCFRKAGFPVEAYPVDWRSETGFLQIPLVSSHLARLDNAAKEWIGLIAYYFTGRTSALFPAP